MRTVLGPFDKQFNAITGLNGSGKSNVLDGICFVLGITNLSKVRAGNLSELVYKQGQAGITKASVTIVFNNKEKGNGRSPVGFESHDVITVCRQIVIGGRNRYLLNGKTAQLQEVYNLFHSVQLNINNPHFLIMQGSITKVINMKPQEILGMIEEAAGTSMYESKKNLAIRTLEKKQVKVDEIDRIIKEEIEPQLFKLKAEKASYIQYTQLVQEADIIEKLVTRWRYRAVCDTMNNEDYDSHKSQLSAAKESYSVLKISVLKSEEKLKSDVKSLEKQRQIHTEKERDIEEEIQTEKRTLIESETTLKAKESLLKLNSGKASKSKSSESKLVRAIEVKTGELVAAKNALDECKKNISQLESKIEQSVAGISDLNAGTSGTGGDVSMQQELNEKKSRLEAGATELKSGGIKMKGLEARLKSAKKSANSAVSSEYENLSSQREILKSKIADISKKMAEMNFNPTRFAEIGEQIKTFERKIEHLIEQRNSHNISQRLELFFDPNSAKIDPNQVFGTVAKLLKVKPAFGEKYLAALEILTGAKLFNVVVDSQETCKKLLQNGKLKKRTTILPLDKIQGRKVSDIQLREALAIAAQLRGEALPAIEAVEFADQIAAAIEYVFGTTFLCDGSEIGKRITFNPNLTDNQKVRSITNEGDVYDPKGSLTGGDSGGRGGLKVLSSIFAFENICVDLSEIQAQTETLQGERQRMQSYKEGFEKATRELSNASHSLSLVESKLKATSQAQFVDEIELLESEISALGENLKDIESTQIELQTGITHLEKEIRDLAKNQKSKVDEMTKKVTNLRTERKRANDTCKESESRAENCELALQTAQQELETFHEDLTVSSNVCLGLESEISDLDLKIQILKDKIEGLVGKLEEARVGRISFDTTIAKMVAGVDEGKRQLEETEIRMKQLETGLATLNRDRSEEKSQLDSLEKEYTWLKNERSEIVVCPNLAKKSKSEIAALETKLDELKLDVNIRGKNVNRRILPLIERSEKEADDLLEKRKNLETEKKAIHTFIEELDDKKGRALSKTWQIVNSNFGSIFRSLLPKVDAKLAPPEGLTALEGLELKVQLGSVWKDSLTELSGGQKSLLALSLVLALLLFKPAPFYILDEVDAALDISHTRNIGKMIKQYFPHSQFVIVSLKDGMFSNANVLFRVRFENGTSVVDRHEQHNDPSGGGVTIEFKENVYIDESTENSKKTIKKVAKKSIVDQEDQEEYTPPPKRKTKAK